MKDEGVKDEEVCCFGWLGARLKLLHLTVEDRI